MRKKFVSGFILSLFLVFLLTGCIFKGSDKEITTAGQLTKNHLTPDERIIYLMEDDHYTPYYLVSAYNNDSVILLRKDIIQTEYPFSYEDNGYYAESPIDLFLNSDFLKIFPESFLNIIPDTSIKITCRFPDTDNIEEIDRKVFLLSASEVGIDMDIVNNEGKALDLFNDTDYRLALKDGKACGWWLRSTYKMDRGLAWHIAFDGTIHGSAVQVPSGIRPALCIPSSTPVNKNDELGGYTLD